MGLTDHRIQVHPGDGLVARNGDTTVVVTDVAANQAFTDALLALVEGAGPDSAPLHGRRLVRKLAGMVTEADTEEVGSFGVVTGDADGLAVMLYGSVDMEIVGPGTAKERLSGRDVATWVDRVIRQPFDRLVLLRTDAAEPALDPRGDLRSGAVAGSGITVAPRGAPLGAPEPAPAAAPAAQAPAAQAPAAQAPAARPEAPVEVAPAPAGSPVSEPTTDEMPVVAPEPVVEAPAAEAPAAEAPIAGPPAAEPVRPGPLEAHIEETGPPSGDYVPVAIEPLPVEDIKPLPVATGGRPAPEAAAPDAVKVKGIYCSRGHFDDPRAKFCAICGISMVQKTHNPILGPRPPLGVLVLDDGASFTLDHDYVIGREPDNAPEITSGNARPLTLQDPDRQLSRVHARIQLRDWDVRIEDARSTNGTTILRPGTQQWVDLPPEEPTTINPGTRIRMGSREMVFDSHHRSS